MKPHIRNHRNRGGLFSERGNGIIPNMTKRFTNKPTGKRTWKPPFSITFPSEKNLPNVFDQLSVGESEPPQKRHTVFFLNREVPGLRQLHDVLQLCHAQEADDTWNDDFKTSKNSRLKQKEEFGENDSSKAIFGCHFSYLLLMFNDFVMFNHFKSSSK